MSFRTEVARSHTEFRAGCTASHTTTSYRALRLGANNAADTTVFEANYEGPTITLTTIAVYNTTAGSSTNGLGEVTYALFIDGVETAITLTRLVSATGAARATGFAVQIAKNQTWSIRLKMVNNGGTINSGPSNITAVVNT